MKDVEISLTNNHFSPAELDCRARGSPVPVVEWKRDSRPVLSSHLVDVTMAAADFVEKRVRVRGAGKNHEVGVS